MVKQVIRVDYQGQTAGAVSFDTDTGTGAFEYEPDFIETGIELAPATMPLSDHIYSFPDLNFATFKGLPGLIADSLPDDFGNAVLNAWVARQGKSPQKITPLQRLQYIGKRGLGALEYAPPKRLKGLAARQQVDIATLVSLAQDVLDTRANFNVPFHPDGAADHDVMLALLSVGTSAGGARPKAVLAFNDEFTKVRSGQATIPDGFTHYLMKFDGVHEHTATSETFGDPQGYGAMEYVYYQMARASGIDMMPCHLLNEGPRRHFITQRFDRTGNHKRHIQTLNAMAHVDYKQPGSYSWEEVFSLARQLGLPASDAEQLLKRLIFNIIARNHDDHAKNISFVLDDTTWRLAPAYDLAYSYKPGSRWVSQHWMSLNNKRDNYTRADLHALQTISPLFTKRRINQSIEQTRDAVSQWPTRARQENVPARLVKTIASNLRLDL